MPRPLIQRGKRYWTTIVTRQRQTNEECAIQECGGNYVKDEGDYALREKWCSKCWFVPTESYFRDVNRDPWEQFRAWRDSEGYPHDRTKTHGGFAQAYID